MQKILIKTRVLGSVESVFLQFDKKLFKALEPPFTKIEIINFDGSNIGDEVRLKIKPLIGAESDWLSLITHRELSSEQAMFVDVGKKLPVPLTNWVHRHIVRRVDDKYCEIIDDIEFDTKYWILTKLIFLPLYLQFLYRKPVYRKYFGN